VTAFVVDTADDRSSVRRCERERADCSESLGLFTVELGDNGFVPISANREVGKYRYLYPSRVAKRESLCCGVACVPTERIRTICYLSDRRSAGFKSGRNAVSSPIAGRNAQT